MLDVGQFVGQPKRPHPNPLRHSIQIFPLLSDRLFYSLTTS